MLSPSDTILIFVVALLLFGPEQLPKIARQLGDAMRHIQSTTCSFMAEMDRAAAAHDLAQQSQWNPPAGGVAGASAESELNAGSHLDGASKQPGTSQHPEDASDLESDTRSQAPDAPNPSP